MPDNPLEGLTRRQLAELRAKIDKELQSCALCGREGAQPYRIIAARHETHSRASVDLCRPCFERIRMPEARADA